MKFLVCLTKAVLLAALILAVGCTDLEEPESYPALADSTRLPDQESWESTITISQEGRPVALVWAQYIANYQKDAKTYLEDSVHVDFYDREGNHSATLTADQGVYEEKKRDLTATGNVIVESDSGVVLESEELFWDNDRQKIISKVPVRFLTETDTIWGDSFESDPDLKNYTIFGARGRSQRQVPLDRKPNSK